MNDNQQTVAGEISLSGIGLHTGADAVITILPAGENHGVKFQRVDLEGAPLIDADCDNVTTVERGTTLEQNGGSISTIEHLMAAFVGLQIDNVLVQVNGPEIPIMDGSSKPFVDALLGPFTSICRTPVSKPNGCEKAVNRLLKGCKGCGKAVKML